MAIAVVVLASVEFHIRNSGLRTIKKLDEDIAKTEADIDRIKTGTKPMELSPDKSFSDLGFEELKGRVHEHSGERGRAWFGCIVAGVDDSKSRQSNPVVEVEIVVTGPLVPSETGMPTEVVRPDTLRGVVYVFEEGVNDDPSDPGVFLGRFNVDSDELPTTKFPAKLLPEFPDDERGIDSFRVRLVTTDSISDDEINQIFEAASEHSRWAIYLTPPVDRIAGVFDRLTEKEMQAIPEELWARFQPRPMPELSEEDIEYIRGLELDGLDVSDLDSRATELLERTVEILERDRNTMDTTWAQARDKVVAIWKRYRESMDDAEAEFAQEFSAALDSLYKQRSSLYRDIKGVESDIEIYKASGGRARAESEMLNTQLIPLEEKRVAAMEVQRNEVKNLLMQYDEETAGSVLRIEKFQVLAAAYAAAITDAQLKAVEKIEERTESLMQVRE